MVAEYASQRLFCAEDNGEEADTTSKVPWPSPICLEAGHQISKASLCPSLSQGQKLITRDNFRPY